MPLSLWELNQELARGPSEDPLSKDPLHVYRQRVGSILEGGPVIDYTTEGTRASRLPRWDKARNDIDSIAAQQFTQALR